MILHDQTIAALPHPSWAERTVLEHGVIEYGDTVLRHTWSSPVDAAASTDGLSGPVRFGVELIREDVVLATERGLVTVAGQPEIFVGYIGATFTSPTEARRCARALLDCADRLEGSAAEDRTPAVVQPEPAPDERTVIAWVEQLQVERDELRRLLAEVAAAPAVRRKRATAVHVPAEVMESIRAAAGG